ncbi:hypothetical protein GCM10007881_24550 [Mesorhizobium huakuii]|nr:hypothetical protein GCM10007881_24550 [Mesorhizobium huakuii]
MRPVDRLSKRRSRQGPDGTQCGEDKRAAPPDVTLQGMAAKVRECVGGHRKRACADGNMGLGDADDIEQQRRGKDRSAAADKTKGETNQAARAQGGK